jgi:hypothetical protein
MSKSDARKEGLQEGIKLVPPCPPYEKSPVLDDFSVVAATAATVSAFHFNAGLLLLAQTNIRIRLLLMVVVVDGDGVIKPKLLVKLLVGRTQPSAKPVL